MDEENVPEMDHLDDTENISEPAKETFDETEAEEPEGTEVQEPEKVSPQPFQFDQVLLDQTVRPQLLRSVGFDTYTRGCKWSPDGLCILSLSNDNRLEIFDTPQDTFVEEYHPAVAMREAETVYDFQWYPMMDSSRPETCCLATTSQYQPIHLYDAYDGHLRATYRLIF